MNGIVRGTAAWIAAALSLAQAESSASWRMSLPPHSQGRDCEISWNRDAQAADWVPLRVELYESFEECEAAREALASRAAESLPRHLEYLDARDSGLRWWWNRLVMVPLGWFWVGFRPAKSDECGAILSGELWGEARCIAMTEAPANPRYLQRPAVAGHANLVDRSETLEGDGGR